jgi:hypothetical protein
MIIRDSDTPNPELNATNAHKQKQKKNLLGLPLESPAQSSQTTGLSFHATNPTK